MLRADDAIAVAIARGLLGARPRATARVVDAALVSALPMPAPSDAAAGRRYRVPAADLALGLRALATLLEADLPMSQTLAAFGDLAPPTWRPGLPALVSAVREGSTLSAALADAPIRLPSVVVGLVRAGEAGGGLPAAVRQAAELTERAARTRAAVRAALAYPALLGVAASASVGLLVGVVLPRFAVILSDLGQTLPTSTRVVLRAAMIARAAAPGATLSAVGAVIAWRIWVTSPGGLAAWHAFLLRLPVVGPARHAGATARSAAALAALLDRGVSAAPALAHAARAAGDVAVEARLSAAREGIVAGESLAAALDRTAALTPVAVRLVRAGEASGRLAPMLAHAAQIEAERAESIVTQAVRLLEPALILGFGALVALVAAALLQAVYSVRPGA